MTTTDPRAKLIDEIPMLSVRLMNALNNAKIRTLGALHDFHMVGFAQNKIVGRKAFSRLKGVGAKTISEADALLAVHGIPWPDSRIKCSSQRPVDDDRWVVTIRCEAMHPSERALAPLVFAENVQADSDGEAIVAALFRTHLKRSSVGATIEEITVARQR